MSESKGITPSVMKREILKMYEQGWVAFRTIDGVMTANMKDFVSQPVEGLLYDLNRNRTSVLADTSDPRWVNDLATCEVITYLHKNRDELLSLISDYQGEVSMLENQNKELTDILISFQTSAQKFVSKVESGMAKSKETYTEFKKLLSKLDDLKNE